MIILFKKRKLKAELAEVEKKLYYKRIINTNLFLKVKDDPNRHTGTDTELKATDKEVNDLIFKFVKLHKAVYGKKSKYYSSYENIKD